MRTAKITLHFQSSSARPTLDCERLAALPRGFKSSRNHGIRLLKLSVSLREQPILRNIGPSEITHLLTYSLAHSLSSALTWLASSMAASPFAYLRRPNSASAPAACRPLPAVGFLLSTVRVVVFGGFAFFAVDWPVASAFRSCSRFWRRASAAAISACSANVSACATIDVSLLFAQIAHLHQFIGLDDR